MRFGLAAGYWSRGVPEGQVEAIAAAEEAGFDSVWTAEAYGSDALTPLAWWGASTEKLRLGTAIMQMSARTPTAAAMAAMTMDHLSGGRFIMGLGVSGPQVVEGWYGQPFPRPLERTREYIDVVRQVIAREAPVTFEGKQIQLPMEGGTGLGKALKSTVHLLRTDLPIALAAEGPKNVALAAEIADAWIPFWFSPKADEFYRGCLAEGFAREGARHTLDDFEVFAPVPVIPCENAEDGAAFVRHLMALYIGGMGASDANFHADVFVRMGWGDVCDQVSELYRAKRKDEAAKAIPLEMVEDVALVGPMGKIKDELEKWDETVITTMLVMGDANLIRSLAELQS